MKQEVLSTYRPFIQTVWPYVHISDEKDYQEALELVEYLLESSTDTLDDPLNPLIEMLSGALERYELLHTEIKIFVEQAEDLPKDRALLQHLMNQYQLTGNDFPEIGSRSMVSKVISGKRALSRSAIEKLSVRFNLSPALFF